MNYYKFYAIIRDKFDLFLERRLIVSLQQFERKSLQEINQSIDVPKGILLEDPPALFRTRKSSSCRLYGSGKLDY